jgi:integrase
MRVGDVQVEGVAVTVVWPRAKGGKVMRDTLPTAVGKALTDYLAMLYGDVLDTTSPVWVSLAHDRSYGKHLSERSIANVCVKHLGTSKVHTLRHTFAHAMEEAGAKVSDIQSRLGHASLATTGRYLASLRSAENKHAEVLAAMFGIE